MGRLFIPHADELDALILCGRRYAKDRKAHDAKHVLKTKKLLKRAFEYQRDNHCFSFIEVLSTCPTNWGMSSNEAMEWVADTMVSHYPLGVIKEPGKQSDPQVAESSGSAAK